MDADDESTPQIEAGEKYYQLTHDYLVSERLDVPGQNRIDIDRGSVIKSILA